MSLHDVIVRSPNDRTSQTRDEFLAAEVAFGPCPPEWVEQSENLRWLQLDSVGIDPYQHLDWQTIGPHITCTNLRGFFAVPVCESALAGALALFRGILPLHEARANTNWCRDQVRPTLRLLAGATVLLLGHGTIGKRLRKLLTAFDTRVAAFDIHDPEAELGSHAELDDAIAHADLVVAALPDTPYTRGLLDHRRLALCRPHTLIINVGRGGAIDESALIEALESGQLGGAVLDVTAREPLPADDPLWRCSNVLLTQHTAGGSAHELAGKVDLFLKNLDRYLHHQPLENVVNWDQGY